MEPLELWHSIIDAEAAFHCRRGNAPRLLRLPVSEAIELSKLRGNDFALSGRVMKEGYRVFEKTGLLSVPVEIVHDIAHFEFV